MVRIDPELIEYERKHPNQTGGGGGGGGGVVKHSHDAE